MALHHRLSLSFLYLGAGVISMDVSLVAIPILFYTFFSLIIQLSVLTLGPHPENMTV